jgi:hypothetical protein
MLTLAEAIKQCNMDRRTVKRWYAQGYYMREDRRWYITVGGKEFVKYYTGA